MRTPPCGYTPDGVTKRVFDAKGGTMRLGAYPCVLQDDSLALKLYGRKKISERHRHRYEFNNGYVEGFSAKGMLLSGVSPDGRSGGDHRT